MENIKPKIESSFFYGWYSEHGRSFPWRENECTPYVILNTEILLRQTQASSVAKIWKVFSEKYVSPFIMESTSDGELISDIEILGFKNVRKKAFKLSSNHLIKNHNGKVPNDEELLLKIPHVGQYTTNALLSFCFKKRKEIVDTNVVRFISRFLGLKIKSIDNRRNKLIWEITKQILPDDSSKIREHNYGLLDFTALVCKSRIPLCENCYLNKYCEFFKKTDL